MIDWVAALDKVYPERLTGSGPIVALSDDWYRARRGRCTASVRASVIANGRPKTWAKMAADIEYELCENYHREEVNVKSMRWGREYEFQAIANAELEMGQEAIEPGLVFHPKFPYAAATPDFYMGSDITGQIKCPSVDKNHLEFVYQKKLPSKYLYQVQWEAWVSQRTRIVFMSYDPRQPVATRCAIIELDADLVLWKTFEDRLADFKTKFESAAVQQKPAVFKGFDGIPEIF